MQRVRESHLTEARGGVGNYPAFRAFMRACAAAVALLLRALPLVIIANLSLAQSAPAGYVIRNLASVSYQAATVPRSVNSNEVALTVEPSPSRSTIVLARFASAGAGGTFTATAGPTQCRASAGLVTLAPPQVAGSGAIDPTQPAPLASTATLHGGDAAFIRLIDADQNRDANVLETVEVRVTARATGDSERLLLTETGVNTGEFVGYVPTQIATATSGNCALDLARDSEIDVSYVDPRDATDSVLASGLVDPFGLVFDSTSGAPVNGARVRLVDAATGQPALILGDDGVSRFPSEVITGQPATDSGGTVYTLPAGVFRFPLVSSGSYRVIVEPPGGYLFASTATIADLQRLPGAPYRLGDGSFGRPFSVAAPVASAVDVPLDPSGDSLVLRKVASASLAAIGDFIAYELTAQNTSVRGEFRNVRIADQLPAGLRYRTGSVRVDGRAAAEPQISSDGRVLNFGIATLPPGASVRIRYVVEVTVGARGEELVNTASAVALGGTRSNEARAIVRLRNELFADKGFLVGRIVESDCAAPLTDSAGVAGVRIYLEDGRYAVTDVDGRYHFEAVEAGTHVVQLDPVTVPAYLELQDCEPSVRHSGRAYSQFVDLRAGALWRADFRLRTRPAPVGNVTLQMSSTLAGGAIGWHDLILRVGAVAVVNARLQIMLPPGLTPQLGQITRDGAPLQGARFGSEVLSLPLGSLAAGSEHRLRVPTHAGAAAVGELAIKALASVDTPTATQQRTEPVVNVLKRGEARFASARYTFSPRFAVLETELRAADRDELERLLAEWHGARKVAINVVGHTDKTRIAARNRQRFADNYVLSAARARVVADYLAQRLQIPAERMQIEGVGPDEPLVTGSDPESLATNRRVEISISGERFAGDAPLQLVTWQSAVAAIATRGEIARRTAGSVDAPRRAPEPAAGGDLDIEQLSGSIVWILPDQGAGAQIASVKVAIAHRVDQSVTLSVNGVIASPLNFDGATVNSRKLAAVSRWRGLDLRDGDNLLTAIVRNADGTEAATMQRTVHYGGGAVRAELDRERSQLTADGTTRPVIVLRLFDAYGKPARHGTIGAFRVDPPYRSWWEVKALDDNPLLAVGSREPTYEVDADGTARLELEPTSQTGTVTVRLRYSERQSQEIRAWLAPAARDWIMVAVAEGTAAWRSISRNMQPAPGDAANEEGFDGDGRVAFFAKGRIRGDYLLTLAYDSTRDTRAARERLKGVIDPDQYYLLYGDGTEQRFEAATAKRVFLKLERRQFVALFGDFDTGFTVTELARYSRSLTGLKTDYAGERTSLTTFAARTDLGFVRDQLRGDGTSGLYRLTRRPLVIGSDKIRIEVRDRFKSEQVIESRELARFLDYSIDYEAGTLFFKAPVASRDVNFNPLFIVAEYETRGTGEEVTTAGARGAMKFAEGRLEIGASAIADGSLAGDSKVGGADLKWQISPITELRAEIAHSQSDDPARADSALAWLTEIKHLSDRLEYRAYAREQQAGFGIDQQSTTESGTRKAGADVRWNFAEHWAVQGETFLQRQLESGAERQLVSAELRHQRDTAAAAIGARHVGDQDASGRDLSSDQLYLTGSVDLWDRKLTLRASGETALNNRDESADYPSRSLLGVDWHLRNDTTLFAEWEHADGAALQSDMTRVGLRARPWEQTQIVTSVNQTASEYGPRTFANFGLTQSLKLSPQWTVDLGLDQSNTLRGAGLAPLNPNVPLASGTTTDDFFATFVGAQYHSEQWTMTGRTERRSSDSETRWVFTGGWYREPVNGHALSLSLQTFTADSRIGAPDATQSDLRLAWAYRPDDSEWIVLNRTDFKRDTRDAELSRFESLRWVNNLHANWQAGPATQLGLQLGLRDVVSSFDGDEYRGLSSLLGADARHDLPWRPLGRPLDVGLHAALLNSWNSNISDFTLGVDIGVTPATNIWISLGYNFAGFRDDDFSAGRSTERGPYLRVRIKADQDSFRDLRLDSLRPAR